MPLRPEADRQALLRLARAAVEVAALNRAYPPIPGDGAFQERCGVFVTLRIDRRLRGCIGILDGREALGRLIVRCAVSAASEDPRFSPVSPGELEVLRIELSILSPLTPIRPTEIVIGRHGIAVLAEGRRGVLLPQVALEHQLSVEQFLGETCQKAGLARDIWRAEETQILGFTTEVLAEQ